MARSRSRSGGRSRSSGFSRSSSSSSLRNPPQKVNSAPPPANHQANNGGSSFLGNIVEGMGWGAGMGIARRAVDSIFGPRVILCETVASSGPATPAAAPNANSLSNACGLQNKAFTDCLNTSGDDIGKCQFYMDMLQECRKGSGAGLNA